MEWGRLKTLIILILLIVNRFLLVLVATRWEESARYERMALEQTVQALERRGVQVEAEALTGAEGLSPMTAERDMEREAKLVRTLLDAEVQGDNRGGGVYLYQGALGEVSLRAGGELTAQLARDEHWRADRPESHAAGLLRRLGIQGEQLGVSQEGGETRVWFRQSWNGVPVFSCELELVYRDGLLSAIEGTLLLAAESGEEEARPLTLSTALLRFSEEVGATGDVYSAIRSMRPGYRTFAQSVSGGVRLTPVWLVSTDTADYYLDCATGGLTRVE